MEIRKVNIKDKADLITELHSYKVIAQMNDYYFKLVKARRDFVWHHHPETDDYLSQLRGTSNSLPRIMCSILRKVR